MNERIEQLDKQAKLWAIDNTNFPISSHIPAGYTEKFAELIVQECAGIYSKIDNGNLHMGTDNYLEALHKTFRS